MPKDYVEAVKWFRSAAEQNEAKAQYDLGICYYTGTGVRENYAEALKWFHAAADQNSVDALSMLGNCYYTGMGAELERNYVEAAKWYQKAAEQNGSPLVFVNGEVRRAGRIDWTPGLTISNAIALAGGFRDFADRGRIEIRRQAGHVERYSLRPQHAGTNTVSLERGDVVHVGMRQE